MKKTENYLKNKIKRPDLIGENNPMHRREVKEKLHLSVLKRNKGSLHYVSSHNRIRLLFDKANKCENKKCKKRSKIYEWVLIKGKKHDGNRNSYMQMCRSCHWSYDGTGKRIQRYQFKKGVKRIYQKSIKNSSKRVLEGSNIHQTCHQN